MSADTEEFAELYRRWFAAIPDDREGFFERHLSDDWHYTNFFGTVRGKQEYASYIQAVPPGAGPREAHDLLVRRFGELAIVHGGYRSPPSIGGEPTEARFTAVWIHRDGRWQALTHHATLVKDEG